jgi:hypothetical protein
VVPSEPRTACASRPDPATSDRIGRLTVAAASRRYDVPAADIAQFCRRHPEVAIREPWNLGRFGFRYLIDPDALRSLLERKRRPPRPVRAGEAGDASD